MKKLIVIILICSLAIAATVAGSYYLFRRNTGVRLLNTAMVALRAKNYTKAADAAEQYVNQVPGDWRGHQTRGEALLRLARYEQARHSFQEATRLKPTEAGPVLGLASTYSFAAKRTLGRTEGPLLLDDMKSALEKFASANKEIISKQKDIDPAKALDLKDRLGRDYQSISSAWRTIGEKLAEEAQRYTQVRSTAIAEARREESLEAFEQSQLVARKAIDVLSEVIKADASRPEAAGALVELCLEHGDMKSLETASKAIMALDNPPAIAAMQLTLHELKHVTQGTRAEQKAKLDEVCHKLDELLKVNPDELPLRLTRAETAMMAEDFETAERICNKILEENSRQLRARLVLGQIQLARKQFAEAAKTLGDLKSDYDKLTEAHYYYAIASSAMGNIENARHAMRFIVSNLDPDHSGARAFLADSLMRSGFFEQAFADAEAYYQAHPDDPRALQLIVRTAMGLPRPREKMVKNILQIAWSKYTLGPEGKEHYRSAEMMSAVGDGYQRLGMADAARKAYARAAQCKPTKMAGRLAVAHAMQRLGRSPEAEKVLQDELKINPDEARLHFALGRLYGATNRQPQAIAELVLASELVPHRVDFRLAVAQLWFDLGDLDRCLGVLDTVAQDDEEANLMRVRIRLLQGQKVPVEQVLKQIDRTREAGLPLAMAYLASGRPKWCANVCKNALRSNPNDRALRFTLGQALLTMGPENEKECIEQWSQVLSSAPHELPIYLSITGLMARNNAPEKILFYLSKIKNSRPEMVAMAAGWLYARQGDFDKAAKAYSAVASDSNFPIMIRQQARLLEAKAKASAGKLDEALEQLAKLAEDPKQMRAALETQAEVFVRAGRKSEGLAAMQKLARIAADDKDGAAIRRTVQMMLGANGYEQADKLCDKLIELRPYDARSYILKASVLNAAGQKSQIVDLLSKAIEMQPGNIKTRVELAKILDDQDKPREALETIDRIGQLGKTGEARQLLERGKMLARWGLTDRAIKWLDDCSRHPAGDNPVVKLDLGKTLAALGATDRAREILGVKHIPAHSAQFISAQLALSVMADSEQQKLDILDALDKARPDRPRVLERRMQIMIRLGKSSDAVKIFQHFMSNDRKANKTQAMLHRLALQAMVESNNATAAAALAIGFADKGDSPRWKQVGILVSLDSPNADFAKALAPMPQAGLHDALLGIVIAARENDSAKAAQWLDKIEQLSNLGATNQGPPVPPSHALLATMLATGRSDDWAKLDRLIAQTSAPDTARELTAYQATGDEDKVRTELITLLKATIADDLGMAKMSRDWALAALKARPQSQWAASLVINTVPDITTHREVADMLKPADCALAMSIRSSLLQKEGRYNEAAKLLGKAAAASGDNPYLVYAQAAATENAGDSEQALSLYEQVWQAAKAPQVGNSVAFLISQLHPDDPAKLKRALAMAETAVASNPSDPVFLDTRGWILLLQGKTAAARADLRRAVKGMPNSPSVHYHVGTVEEKAGDKELAKWHYEAAVSAAAKAEAAGKLTPSSAKAAKLAQESLARTAAAG